MAEKGLNFKSHLIDLGAKGQLDREYMKINPNGVVPSLVHDNLVIIDSSVICEYLDGLTAHNPLMPADPVDCARTRTWGVYTLEYHDSVNTLTFSSYQRQMLLAKSPEDLEVRWQSIPDPIKVRKLKDLVANGADSDYVPVALGKLALMCAEMDAALAHGDWLMGDQYSLADALVTPYFYRIDCIGLSGLWETRYPRTTAWFARVSQRPSLAAATAPWLDENEIERIRAIGTDTFVAGGQFSSYL